MYPLDTNAIIYFLKDDPQAVSILRDVFEQDVPVYISAITEVELFGFPKLTDQEAEQIEAMIGSLAVIPVDSRIARTAGLIRRNYRVNIADSVVAATALFTGTTLFTRNLRDFRRIPGLSLSEI